jgi:hypothetical protein
MAIIQIDKKIILKYSEQTLIQDFYSGLITYAQNPKAKYK